MELMEWEVERREGMGGWIFLNLRENERRGRTWGILTQILPSCRGIGLACRGIIKIFFTIYLAHAAACWIWAVFLSSGHATA